MIHVGRVEHSPDRVVAPIAFTVRLREQADRSRLRVPLVKQLRVRIARPKLLAAVVIPSEINFSDVHDRRRRFVATRMALFRGCWGCMSRYAIV